MLVANTVSCICATDKDHTTKIALKKVRKNINQTLALEQAFAIHRYPDESYRKKLAKQTRLSEKQIWNWFSAKRSKEKLKQCESTQFAGELIDLKCIYTENFRVKI